MYMNTGALAPRIISPAAHCTAGARPCRRSRCRPRAATTRRPTARGTTLDALVEVGRVGLGVEPHRIAVAGLVGVGQRPLRQRRDLAQQGAGGLLVGVREGPGPEAVLHAEDLEEVELDVADVRPVVADPACSCSPRGGRSASLPAGNRSLLLRGNPCRGSAWGRVARARRRGASGRRSGGRRTGDEGGESSTPDLARRRRPRPDAPAPRRDRGHGHDLCGRRGRPRLCALLDPPSRSPSCCSPASWR